MRHDGISHTTDAALLTHSETSTTEGSGERGAARTGFSAEAVPLRGSERRLEIAERDARMRLVLGRRWR